MNQKGFAPIILIILALGVVLVGGIFFNRDQILSKLNFSTESEVLVFSPSPTAAVEPTTTPATTPSAKKQTISATVPTPTPIPRPEVSVMIMGQNPVQYRLFINWKNVPNPTSRDWIGVYPFGEKGDNPLSERIYVTGCTIKSEMEKADGFSKPGMEMGGCPLPLPLDPGEYEVRLYKNDTTERIATSPPFSVK